MWTDSNGTYKVEAEFTEFKDGKVWLKRGDGKTIVVPLEKLSKADQEFVKTATSKKAPSVQTPAGAGPSIEECIERSPNLAGKRVRWKGKAKIERNQYSTDPSKEWMIQVVIKESENEVYEVSQLMAATDKPSDVNSGDEVLVEGEVPESFYHSYVSGGGTDWNSYSYELKNLSITPVSPK